MSLPAEAMDNAIFAEIHAIHQLRQKQREDNSDANAIIEQFTSMFPNSMNILKK